MSGPSEPGRSPATTPPAAATSTRRGDYGRIGGFALALLLGWLVWKIVQPL